MSYYVVSGRQVAEVAIAVALLVSVCSLGIVSFYNASELPEVHVDPNGRCVKVINFKNGDGYTCQDRDVVLRRYRTVVD